MYTYRRSNVTNVDIKRVWAKRSESSEKLRYDSVGIKRAHASPIKDKMAMYEGISWVPSHKILFLPPMYAPKY